MSIDYEQKSRDCWAALVKLEAENAALKARNQELTDQTWTQGTRADEAEEALAAARADIERLHAELAPFVEQRDKAREAIDRAFKPVSNAFDAIAAATARAEKSK